MNVHLKRTQGYLYVLRHLGFWLLALEGILLSVRFLVPLGLSFATLPPLLQHQSMNDTILFVVLFFLLPVSSIYATAQQIAKRTWDTIPATVIIWLSVGGALLLVLVGERAVPIGWTGADLALFSCIWLTTVLYCFVYISDTLLTW